MKLFGTLALAGIASLTFACSASVGPQDEDSTEVVGERLCANTDGTNAVMAAFAVATAKEMHRWNAPVDYQWNSTTGMLETSAAGRARCGGTCRNVQAILDMQKPAAFLTVRLPDGTLLNSYSLQAVMKDSFDRQVRCNAWQGEYTTNGCWVDAHDLWFNNSYKGTCGNDFYFWANKAGTSTKLGNRDRLQYQLYFARYPINEYLNYHMTNNDVIVDPTLGLTEGDNTSSGSCNATCSKYSTTSLVGSCCSCNGVTKTFSRSPFSADVYLCK